VKKLAGLLTLLAAALTLDAQPALRLKTRPTRAGGARADAPQNSRTPGRSHWVIQFRGAPTLGQMSELGRRGVRVLGYVPDYALSVVAAQGTEWDGLDAQWVGQIAPQDKVSPVLRAQLHSGERSAAVVEFYTDVDANEVRQIATNLGLAIQENPDLIPNHLLVWGDSGQIAALAAWDEISYIFPASAELTAGTFVNGCAGALTNLGAVGQSVAAVDDGWDGPGKGSADLMYSFGKVTDKLSVDASKAEISRALAEWAKYVQLSFTLTNNSAGPRTLAILFASGEHGDRYPFDGPHGVLAHTFYPVPTNPEPIAGDMHFDNDESWKIGADVDVFSIALHEAGHALGLGHSDNPEAVMYPYYRMQTALQPDDIAAIRELYAARDELQAGNPAAPATPAPPASPQNPLILVIQTPPNSTTASSITLSGSFSGGTGAVSLSWISNQGFSGATQASPNWTSSAIPLNEGVNIITVTARDSLQNQVVQTVTVTRDQPATPSPAPPPAPAPAPGTPDSTAPSLTILSPATSTWSTSAGSVIVSGTASDNTGVTKVTWTASTGASGTAAGTTNWSTPPIPLYVGTTTIVIRASDAAGNTSWRSLVVTRN